MNVWSITGLVCGLMLSPLLPGVVNRAKALFAGRRGPPLMQAYFDIAKLLRKGAVYSRTTTWLFVAMPAVAMATVLLAWAIVPVGGAALISFEGDIVLFAYAFGLMRFFTVLAALDTGSSFEGMGASREVLFSTLAEPALFICFATLAYASHSLSLATMFSALGGDVWSRAGLALVLVAIVLLIVAVVENCRIPFDDPHTHLELTMIHEVMVLDHGGPDLGLIQYSAALKLWVLSALVVNIGVSFAGVSGAWALMLMIAGMIVVAIVIGIIESIMARLALLKVPHVLAGAIALAVIAFALTMRFAQ